MLLLSCTSYSAFLILRILRIPRACLKQLGTEYVQLWSTVPYQAAHTPKQEGRGCVKRGWKSPKASALLHILLSISDHNCNKESSSVLVWTCNWVNVFLEHFLLPRCTCLFLEVWQVIRGVDSFSAAAYLQILPRYNNHIYNEEFRIVLVKTRNWGMHF